MHAHGVADDQLASFEHRVQWDVTFDLAYDAGIGAPRPLQADLARPGLTFLAIPFGW